MKSRLEDGTAAPQHLKASIIFLTPGFGPWITCGLRIGMRTEGFLVDDQPVWEFYAVEEVNHSPPVAT